MIDNIAVVTLLAALVLNCGLACWFLFLVPPETRHHKVQALWYFRGYFIATCLGYVFYALRQYDLMALSVFANNGLFLLAAYCVVFGVRWRYAEDTHVWRHPAIVHVLLFACVQTFLFLRYPDHELARTVLVYVNVTAVLLYCLSLLARYRHRDEHNRNLLTVCIGVATVAVFAIPVTYVASNDLTVFFLMMLLVQNIITVMLFGAFYASFLFDAVNHYRQQSAIDELTGLYQRRVFLAQAEGFFRAARRHDYPVVLLLCDLHALESINRQQSLEEGDRVLTILASTLRNVTREEDILGRLGDQVVAALLPQTSTDSAQYLVERIKKALAQSSLRFEQQNLSQWVGFGVSSIEDHDSAESCLNAAINQALHRQTEGKDDTAKKSEPDISSANPRSL
ncbi:diguanylate cyclase [Aestuariibacter halophilus]|uniref:diguanylate cyclase n=1 Tax=Fluctibacter halophilus TaxID=226011 RepID=A0ABS8G477_9ALTE|nr:diguanylate cyclase [Aestuariibacter halophilus]MCC2614936.1 diguanylate cyclase [Aestuariibacter halophilus]